MASSVLWTHNGFRLASVCNCYCLHFKLNILNLVLCTRMPPLGFIAMLYFSVSLLFCNGFFAIDYVTGLLLHAWVHNTVQYNKKIRH
jgi:hypothetical protein